MNFNYNKKFLPAMAGMTMLALLMITSCKSDDPAQPPVLKSTTYTSSTLNLTYDSEIMPGKSVDIKIDDSNSDKGVMTLYSQFDLTQLSGMGLNGVIPGPGVIPGSAQLSIPINFVAADGCYTFSGSYSTPCVAFKYSGVIDAEKLTLNIVDASLENKTFSGNAFAPAPIKETGVGEYASLPFHLVWELDPAEGVQIPLSELLKVIATAPVIPVYNNTAYMSVAQAFSNVVKTIALNPDGNIPVMYISTLGGAAHLATTTGNMIQYVPNGQGVLLYVNPLSAVSEVLLALSKPQTDAEFVTKTSPIDTPAALRSEGAASADAYRIAMSPEIKDALIKSLLATIAPQLSQGIPLEMAPTQEGADIYFNTQTSVTFMANLLQNLLSNPVIAGTLKEYLQSIHLPQIPDGDVEAVLAQLPAYLEKTTKLEIGLSLVRMK